MRVKQYIILRFQRMAGHLKSIRVLVWVPVVVVNVFLPLLVLFGWLRNGATGDLELTLVQTTQMLLPFFSVWWPMFVFKEYLEADGNELLYVCRSRTKCADLFFVFLPYILNITLFYTVICTLLFPQLWLELPRMVLNCVWYFGLLYFLGGLTHSVTITLMALLLYTLANVLFPGNQVFVPMYYTMETASAPFLLQNSLPLAALGVVLLLCGAVLNKKLLKYN